MKSTRLFGLLALAVVALSSWGFLVHRTTTQLAVYQLPENLQYFFHENLDYLVRYSVRPDQRRNSDPTEGPKHFIDIERFGADAINTMPHDWKGAVAKYGEDSLKKNGIVPYWVIDQKNKLTEAFRNGNRDSILYYAADLAHYIEDAHVPLHTTENHDGQLSGQKGMHSLWESTIPEIELANYNLYEEHKATYIKKPEEAIWKAVRESNALLPQMFSLEKEVTKEFTDSTKYRVQMRNGRESRSYSSAFAKAYAARLGNSINTQLLKSAHLVSDFWYTAWVDAGKPSLEGLMKAPHSAEQRAAWAKELISYKTGQLLKDGLLRARQNQKEGGSGD
ncbi:hypothetical protein EPD60_11380 [Flaviaesturariibacter flavus]|uniref:S1/P1 Nuclease n=1 Tax=Flaviaesturariibacter flavus TaxID=2502780 RepID=A0A4R1BCA5_9BACT|nr:zinc dependent phospholipase C family protein [Flaviaesturariibacter flavus]TCJ14578.1 hypothetical protein EPD60_11380 [Flaviaesturariibacter flavus]